MKKVLIFIVMLLIPLSVYANDYKVTNHIIDTEVEIAGAIKVKELIVVEGKIDYLNRKLNYYSFGTKAWDGKEAVDFEGSSFYNAPSVSINKVSAFKLTDKIDINNLNRDETSALKEFDLKNPSKEGYSYKDNKNGTGDLKILYPSEDNIALYIEYTVNNAVVKHNDIKELNYTFKNLNLNADKTIVRIITPYPVTKEDEDEYNIWIHGPRNSVFHEIVNSNESKVGLYGEFDKVSEFNVRMTMPQDFVGIDMMLNKSNIDALDKIKEVENARKNTTETNAKLLNNIVYVLIGLSVLLLIGTILIPVINLLDKRILILLEIFGYLFCIFNYLFYKFQYPYLYVDVLIPFISLIISKIKKK